MRNYDSYLGVYALGQEETLRLLNFVIVFCVLIVHGKSQSLTAEAEFAAGTVDADNNPIGALDHLRRAVTLDPKMTKAYFAIGSIAEIWCYVDDSGALCQKALDGYQKVVELEPSREDAWKRLAYASYGQGRTDQAENAYRRGLALDPNDPEVLGGLALIDMFAAYHEVYLANLGYRVSTHRKLIESAVCRQVRGRNLATINEGIDFGKKAHEMKNRNIDLMSVLSLLYATRAHIQCGDPKSFKNDMHVSQRWTHLMVKTLMVKTPAGSQNLERMPPGPPPPPPRHCWDFRPTPDSF